MSAIVMLSCSNVARMFFSLYGQPSLPVMFIIVTKPSFCFRLSSLNYAVPSVPVHLCFVSCLGTESSIMDRLFESVNGSAEHIRDVFIVCWSSNSNTQVRNTTRINQTIF